MESGGRRRHRRGGRRSAAARAVGLAKCRSRARAPGPRSGRLRDALTALDAIRPGDPLRPQADELRAQIQQQLLDAAREPDAAVPK